MKSSNVDVKNLRQLKKSDDAKSFTKPSWLKSCQLMSQMPMGIDIKIKLVLHPSA
ncbi:Hypothetical protein FKW44_007125 [Caligus rogercresseyi]|uniref:Uncharacterized protein n=1 Tax=Caligus rogercresseyi TaxID=217165 RepID=A0A7T8KEA8_CALRO|nr:Hypothetical protein FKW44_007125 [Caligus rogercresseyi]